ncbi:hypothetical protein FB451DRAFT_1189054 [Mycena latifolia]|nr:hypothetical protein FB451DRAFT_1189054 [Mycena latifolia]
MKRFGAQRWGPSAGQSLRNRAQGSRVKQKSTRIAQVDGGIDAVDNDGKFDGKNGGWYCQAIHPVSPCARVEHQQPTQNTLSAGAIAGILIGVLSLISLAGLCVWRRRLRQNVLARRTLAASPFILLPFSVVPPTPPLPSAPENNDARSISASTVRQQFLQNEVRAAKEKMVDLEDLERRTWSTNATEASVPSRILRILSTRSASTMRTAPGSSDLVAQLRARNEAQAARIRELEAQMNSEWALGLSDEPPPGYTA